MLWYLECAAGQVEAAHATHARLFQLQQSLNDAYAENAELRAQYDAVKQELAFSALTNGQSIVGGSS